MALIDSKSEQYSYCEYNLYGPWIINLLAFSA